MLLYTLADDKYPASVPAVFCAGRSKEGRIMIQATLDNNNSSSSSSSSSNNDNTYQRQPNGILNRFTIARLLCRGGPSTNGNEDTVRDRCKEPQPDPAGDGDYEPLFMWNYGLVEGGISSLRPNHTPGAAHSCHINRSCVTSITAKVTRAKRWFKIFIASIITKVVTFHPS